MENKGAKYLFSFNCGHGIVPKLCELLSAEGFNCILILSYKQLEPKIPKNCIIIRMPLKNRNDWPDTDERRQLGVLTGKKWGYTRTVLLDDNVIIPVNELLKLVENTPDRVLSGCVLKNSNSHVREINKKWVYYERNKNFPASLYKERTKNSHTACYIDTLVEPTILKASKEKTLIPIGTGGIYKIQVVDTGNINIEILKKLFPVNGFEPWQDMWMMVWAWWYNISIYKFHGIAYERVDYNIEEPIHRVRGRTKQTINEHMCRIQNITNNWPREIQCWGQNFINHRGSQHYLKIQKY
tara:strand:- start:188 stop:1078 length:891 start_codon:yes stop_codon:yes gene_type:complete